jgi:hypothetical protein
MVLPDEFPQDINYEYYIQRALKILEKDFTPKGEAGLVEDDEDEGDEEKAA